MSEIVCETMRMGAVQSPVIPAVGEMIRSCPGTISLGQGVVYYGPPPQAIEMLSRFLEEPENHKYKPVDGITPLQDAIKSKLRNENGIGIARGSRVVVTAGGNMAFMNAILAITDPGDEVILQLPYYFNQEMAVTMVNCRVVTVPTDSHYQLQPEGIRQAITDRTRAVVTISPNNPTGAVYREETLRKVNEICREAGIYHISDEAYEYFTYDRARHFSPASVSDSQEHTISLFSLSKAYGFASWRIGYMIIPEHLFTSVCKIQDTILICPPVISQFAALGAFAAGRAYCQDKIQAIANLREIVLGELDKIKSLCAVPPAEGAFYFLIKLHENVDAMQLVERLIREHGVAVMPGSTFGMIDGCYMRVSYGALSRTAVIEGVRRLVNGLKSIFRA